MRRGNSIPGIGDEARIAAELHAVFGGAERGRADAFAGRQQRPRELALGDLAPDRGAEPPAEVAEIPEFTLVDIFADAAGEHDAAEIAEIGDRIGEIEVFDVVRERGAWSAPRPASRPSPRRPCRVRPVRRCRRRSNGSRPGARDACRRDRGGRSGTGHRRPAAGPPTWTAAVVDHLTMIDEAELGGAAADVDIENALAHFERGGSRSRAVGGQHRFHVVAGGRADELAALLRQHGRDGLRIFAAQRLAGEDHRPGIDIVGLHPGGIIGVLDDFSQRCIVDPRLARIGRERNGRQEEGVARDDVIAARQILGEAAQMDFREDHLGSRQSRCRCRRWSA